MKRNSTLAFAAPFAAWTRLAWKSGEMMLASAQVIQHRTGRMTAASTAPNARDRREFALMGHEKMEAGIESATAMVAQMMAMSPWVGARAATHVMRSAAAAMSLATSRTPGQAMARHANLIRVMTQSAATTAELSGATAKVAQSGLKPIRSRVIANARRLGRR